jgi:hypothetical protein
MAHPQGGQNASGRYPADENKGVVIAVQGRFSAEQFLEHGHGFDLCHVGEIAQVLEDEKEVVQQFFGTKRHGILILSQGEHPCGETVLQDRRGQGHTDSTGQATIQTE